MADKYTENPVPTTGQDAVTDIAENAPITNGRGIILGSHDINELLNQNIGKAVAENISGMAGKKFQGEMSEVAGKDIATNDIQGTIAAAGAEYGNKLWNATNDEAAKNADIISKVDETVAKVGNQLAQAGNDAYIEQLKVEQEDKNNISKQAIAKIEAAKKEAADAADGGVLDLLGGGAKNKTDPMPGAKAGADIAKKGEGAGKGLGVLATIGSGAKGTLTAYDKPDVKFSDYYRQHKKIKNLSKKEAEKIIKEDQATPINSLSGANNKVQLDVVSWNLGSASRWLQKAEDIDYVLKWAPEAIDGKTATNVIINKSVLEGGTASDPTATSFVMRKQDKPGAKDITTQQDKDEYKNSEDDRVESAYAWFEDLPKASRTKAWKYFQELFYEAHAGEEGAIKLTGADIGLLLHAHDAYDNKGNRAPESVLKLGTQLVEDIKKAIRENYSTGNAMPGNNAEEKDEYNRQSMEAGRTIYSLNQVVSGKVSGKKLQEVVDNQNAKNMEETLAAFDEQVVEAWNTDNFFELSEDQRIEIEAGIDAEREKLIANLEANALTVESYKEFCATELKRVQAENKKNPYVHFLLGETDMYNLDDIVIKDSKAGSLESQKTITQWERNTGQFDKTSYNEPTIAMLEERTKKQQEDFVRANTFMFDPKAIGGSRKRTKKEMEAVKEDAKNSFYVPYDDNLTYGEARDHKTIGGVFVKPENVGSVLVSTASMAVSLANPFLGSALGAVGALVNTYITNGSSAVSDAFNHILQSDNVEIPHYTDIVAMGARNQLIEAGVESFSQGIEVLGKGIFATAAGKAILGSTIGKKCTWIASKEAAINSFMRTKIMKQFDTPWSYAVTGLAVSMALAPVEETVEEMVSGMYSGVNIAHLTDPNAPVLKIFKDTWKDFDNVYKEMMFDVIVMEAFGGTVQTVAAYKNFKKYNTNNLPPVPTPAAPAGPGVPGGIDVVPEYDEPEDSDGIPAGITVVPDEDIADDYSDYDDYIDETPVRNEPSTTQSEETSLFERISTVLDTQPIAIQKKMLPRIIDNIYAMLVGGNIISKDGTATKAFSFLEMWADGIDGYTAEEARTQAKVWLDIIDDALALAEQYKGLRVDQGTLANLALLRTKIEEKLSVMEAAERNPEKVAVYKSLIVNAMVGKATVAEVKAAFLAAVGKEESELTETEVEIANNAIDIIESADADVQVFTDEERAALREELFGGLPDTLDDAVDVATRPVEAVEIDDVIIAEDSAAAEQLIIQNTRELVIAEEEENGESDNVHNGAGWDNFSWFIETARDEDREADRQQEKEKSKRRKARFENKTKYVVVADEDGDVLAVNVIPEALWDDEMRETDKAYFNITGQHLNFFLGPSTNNGVPSKRLGFHVADTQLETFDETYIRVDADYSVVAATRHELWHTIAKMFPDEAKEMFELLSAQVDLSSHIEKIATRYKESFEDMSEEEIDERVREEILAYVLGRNKFSDELSSDELFEILRPDFMRMIKIGTGFYRVTIRERRKQILINRKAISERNKLRSDIKDLLDEGDNSDINNVAHKALIIHGMPNTRFDLQLKIDDMITGDLAEEVYASTVMSATVSIESDRVACEWLRDMLELNDRLSKLNPQDADISSKLNELVEKRRSMAKVVATGESLFDDACVYQAVLFEYNLVQEREATPLDGNLFSFYNEKDAARVIKALRVNGRYEEAEAVAGAMQIAVEPVNLNGVSVAEDESAKSNTRKRAHDKSVEELSETMPQTAEEIVETEKAVKLSPKAISLWLGKLGIFFSKMKSNTADRAAMATAQIFSDLAEELKETPAWEGIDKAVSESIVELREELLAASPEAAVAVKMAPANTGRALIGLSGKTESKNRLDEGIVETLAEDWRAELSSYIAELVNAGFTNASNLLLVPEEKMLPVFKAMPYKPHSQNFNPQVDIALKCWIAAMANNGADLASIAEELYGNKEGSNQIGGVVVNNQLVHGVPSRQISSVGYQEEADFIPANSFSSKVNRVKRIMRGAAHFIQSTHGTPQIGGKAQPYFMQLWNYAFAFAGTDAQGMPMFVVDGTPYPSSTTGKNKANHYLSSAIGNACVVVQDTKTVDQITKPKHFTSDTQLTLWLTEPGDVKDLEARGFEVVSRSNTLSSGYKAKGDTPEEALKKEANRKKAKGTEGAAQQAAAEVQSEPVMGIQVVYTIHYSSNGMLTNESQEVIDYVTSTYGNAVGGMPKEVQEALEAADVDVNDVTVYSSDEIAAMERYEALRERIEQKTSAEGFGKASLSNPKYVALLLAEMKAIGKDYQNNWVLPRTTATEDTTNQFITVDAGIPQLAIDMMSIGASVKPPSSLAKKDSQYWKWLQVHEEQHAKTSHLRTSESSNLENLLIWPAGNGRPAEDKYTAYDWAGSYLTMINMDEQDKKSLTSKSFNSLFGGPGRAGVKYVDICQGLTEGLDFSKLTRAEIVAKAKEIMDYILTERPDVLADLVGDLTIENAVYNYMANEFENIGRIPGLVERYVDTETEQSFRSSAYLATLSKAIMTWIEVQIPGTYANYAARVNMDATGPMLRPDIAESTDLVLTQRMLLGTRPKRRMEFGKIAYKDIYDTYVRMRGWTEIGKNLLNAISSSMTVPAKQELIEAMARQEIRAARKGKLITTAQQKEEAWFDRNDSEDYAKIKRAAFYAYTLPKIGTLGEIARYVNDLFATEEWTGKLGTSIDEQFRENGPWLEWVKTRALEKIGIVDAQNMNSVISIENIIKACTNELSSDGIRDFTNMSDKERFLRILTVTSPVDAFSTLDAIAHVDEYDLEQAIAGGGGAITQVIKGYLSEIVMIESEARLAANRRSKRLFNGLDILAQQEAKKRAKERFWASPVAVRAAKAWVRMEHFKSAAMRYVGTLPLLDDANPTHNAVMCGARLATEGRCVQTLDKSLFYKNPAFKAKMLAANPSVPAILRAPTGNIKNPTAQNIAEDPANFISLLDIREAIGKEKWNAPESAEMRNAYADKEWELLLTLITDIPIAGVVRNGYITVYVGDTSQGSVDMSNLDTVLYKPPGVFDEDGTMKTQALDKFGFATSVIGVNEAQMLFGEYVKEELIKKWEPELGRKEATKKANLVFQVFSERIDFHVPHLTKEDNARNDNRKAMLFTKPINEWEQMFDHELGEELREYWDIMNQFAGNKFIRPMRGYLNARSITATRVAISPKMAGCSIDGEVFSIMGGDYDGDNVFLQFLPQKEAQAYLMLEMLANGWLTNKKDAIENSSLGGWRTWDSLHLDDTTEYAGMDEANTLPDFYTNGDPNEVFMEAGNKREWHLIRGNEDPALDDDGSHRRFKVYCGDYYYDAYKSFQVDDKRVVDPQLFLNTFVYTVNKKGKRGSVSISNLSQFMATPYGKVIARNMVKKNIIPESEVTRYDSEDLASDNMVLNDDGTFWEPTDEELEKYLPEDYVDDWLLLDVMTEMIADGEINPPNKISIRKALVADTAEKVAEIYEFLKDFTADNLLDDTPEAAVKRQALIQVTTALKKMGIAIEQPIMNTEETVQRNVDRYITDVRAQLSQLVIASAQVKAREYDEFGISDVEAIKAYNGDIEDDKIAYVVKAGTFKGAGAAAQKMLTAFLAPKIESLSMKIMSEFARAVSQTRQNNLIAAIYNAFYNGSPAIPTPDLSGVTEVFVELEQSTIKSPTFISKKIADIGSLALERSDDGSNDFSTSANWEYLLGGEPVRDVQLSTIYGSTYWSMLTEAEMAELVEFQEKMKNWRTDPNTFMIEEGGVTPAFPQDFWTNNMAWPYMPAPKALVKLRALSLYYDVYKSNGIEFPVELIDAIVNQDEPKAAKVLTSSLLKKAPNVAFGNAPKTLYKLNTAAIKLVEYPQAPDGYALTIDGAEKIIITPQKRHGLTAKTVNSLIRLKKMQAVTEDRKPTHLTALQWDAAAAAMKSFGIDELPSVKEFQNELFPVIIESMADKVMLSADMQGILAPTTSEKYKNLEERSKALNEYRENYIKFVETAKRSAWISETLYAAACGDKKAVELLRAAPEMKTFFENTKLEDAVYVNNATILFGKENPTYIAHILSIMQTGKKSWEEASQLYPYPLWLNDNKESKVNGIAQLEDFMVVKGLGISVTDLRTRNPKLFAKILTRASIMAAHTSKTYARKYLQFLASCEGDYGNVAWQWEASRFTNSDMDYLMAQTFVDMKEKLWLKTVADTRTKNKKIVEFANALLNNKLRLNETARNTQLFNKAVSLIGENLNAPERIVLPSKKKGNLDWFKPLTSADLEVEDIVGQQYDYLFDTVTAFAIQQPGLMSIAYNRYTTQEEFDEEFEGQVFNRSAENASPTFHAVEYTDADGNTYIPDTDEFISINVQGSTESGITTLTPKDAALYFARLTGAQSVRFDAHDSGGVLGFNSGGNIGITANPANNDSKQEIASIIHEGVHNIANAIIEAVQNNDNSLRALVDACIAEGFDVSRIKVLLRTEGGLKEAKELLNEYIAIAGERLYLNGTLSNEMLSILVQAHLTDGTNLLQGIMDVRAAESSPLVGGERRSVKKENGMPILETDEQMTRVEVIKKVFGKSMRKININKAQFARVFTKMFGNKAMETYTHHLLNMSYKIAARIATGHRLHDINGIPMKDANGNYRAGFAVELEKWAKVYAPIWGLSVSDAMNTIMEYVDATSNKKHFENAIKRSEKVLEALKHSEEPAVKASAGLKDDVASIVGTLRGQDADVVLYLMDSGELDLTNDEIKAIIRQLGSKDEFQNILQFTSYHLPNQYADLSVNMKRIMLNAAFSDDAQYDYSAAMIELKAAHGLHSVKTVEDEIAKYKETLRIINKDVAKHADKDGIVVAAEQMVEWGKMFVNGWFVKSNQISEQAYVNLYKNNPFFFPAVNDKGTFIISQYDMSPRLSTAKGFVDAVAVLPTGSYKRMVNKTMCEEALADPEALQPILYREEADYISEDEKRAAERGTSDSYIAYRMWGKNGKVGIVYFRYTEVGKDIIKEVDKLIAKKSSFLSKDELAFMKVLRVVSGPVRLFKLAHTTMNPAFGMRQFIVDLSQAALASQRPFSTFMYGIKYLLQSPIFLMPFTKLPVSRKHRELVETLLVSSHMGYSKIEGAERTQKHKGREKKKGSPNIKEQFSNPAGEQIANFAGAFQSYLEAIPRLAAARAEQDNIEAMRKRGINISELEAMQRQISIAIETMDFDMYVGDALEIANKFIPYFTAWARAQYTMNDALFMPYERKYQDIARSKKGLEIAKFRRAQHKKMLTSIAIQATLLKFMTIFSFFMFGGDDDDESLFTQTGYFVMKLPNGKLFKTRGFIPQLTVPIKFIESIADGEANTTEFWKTWRQQLVNGFMPPTATVLQPIWEMESNSNSFGSDIFSIDEMKIIESESGNLSRIKSKSGAWIYNLFAGIWENSLGAFGFLRPLGTPKGAEYFWENMGGMYADMAAVIADDELSGISTAGGIWEEFMNAAGVADPKYGEAAAKIYRLRTNVEAEILEAKAIEEETGVTPDNMESLRKKAKFIDAVIGDKNTPKAFIKLDDDGNRVYVDIRTSRSPSNKDAAIRQNLATEMPSLRGARDDKNNNLAGMISEYVDHLIATDGKYIDPKELNNEYDNPEYQRYASILTAEYNDRNDGAYYSNAESFKKLATAQDSPLAQFKAATSGLKKNNPDYKVKDGLTKCETLYSHASQARVQATYDLTHDIISAEEYNAIIEFSNSVMKSSEVIINNMLAKYGLTQPMTLDITEPAAQYTYNIYRQTEKVISDGKAKKLFGTARLKYYNYLLAKLRGLV